MASRHPFTDIEVANQCLTGLGETRLTQPLADDENPKSIVLREHYVAVKEFCLAKSNWRFATVKLGLNLLNETPPNRWAAAWQLPADLLKALYVWPPILYELQNGKLLTNVRNGLVLDYIRVVDEAEWPPWFTRLVVAELIMRSCKGITGDDPTNAMTNERTLALNDAYFQDAQQQPNQQVLPSDFIDVRN